MIQLLFMVVLIESFLALLLMVEIGPLRELVMKGLEQMKMNGKGPATVKTVAYTLGAILVSSLLSVFKIQNKWAKNGTLTPMDQVLWRTHLLEASLIVGGVVLSSYWIYLKGNLQTGVVPDGFFKILEPSCVTIGFDLTGFSLFLGYVIDRLHHYLCKLKELKDTVEVSEKDVQRLQKELEEKEEGLSKEMNSQKDKILSLKENMEKLEKESEKDNRMEEAETLVASLQKQLVDLLLEYDRLVEDNQALQCQTLGYKL
ncbi:hypothetical protein Sjap_005922 [Stephania japonica]|uniref:Endoplasmic reticulum transmembrane protein n=1 Tax=Stephania japonica TaxID=461633 RepID=A0AAP0PKK1_9MAGN